MEEIQRHSSIPMNILSLESRTVLSKFFPFYFLPPSLSFSLSPTRLLQLPPFLLFCQVLCVKYCFMHGSSKSFPLSHSHMEERNKLVQYGVILIIYYRDREISFPRWIKKKKIRHQQIPLEFGLQNEIWVGCYVILGLVSFLHLVELSIYLKTLLTAIKTCNC